MFKLKITLGVIFTPFIQSVTKTMKSVLYIIITSSLFFFSAVEANASPTTYGPIKEGETLWYIAYKHKPAGVTRWNMMRAIHLYNRASFNHGDINLLKKGAVLRIPVSKKEVTQFIRGTANTKIDTNTTKVVSTETQTALEKANIELKLLREELAQTRSTLIALKKESKQLTNSERNQYKKSIIDLQQRIVDLEQDNAAIKKNRPTIDTDINEALALKVRELNKAYEEVAILKKQNSLLKEQASAKDSRVRNRVEKDRLVSETIAALNVDIGQLRSRIKELEKLEKLKDAHITELKKTLQHATKVIKEQDVINRKMHAQLADLNANRLSSQQNTSVLVAKENMQAGVAPPLSEMVKNVSPKFWLLLTLGGLLVVLSLLWRSLSQRNVAYEENVRDDKKT